MFMMIYIFNNQIHQHLYLTKRIYRKCKQAKRGKNLLIHTQYIALIQGKVSVSYWCRFNFHIVYI